MTRIANVFIAALSTLWALPLLAQEAAEEQGIDAAINAALKPITDVVVGIVFVVLIILEVVGVTDIFKRV